MSKNLSLIQWVERYGNKERGFTEYIGKCDFGCNEKWSNLYLEQYKSSKTRWRETLTQQQLQQLRVMLKHIYKSLRTRHKNMKVRQALQQCELHIMGINIALFDFWLHNDKNKDFLMQLRDVFAVG